MNFFYTHKAAKQLELLPPAIQKRIIEKMRFYADQSDPLKFAKKLIDSREGEFRFRIGDYRAIFTPTREGFLILRIAHRREVYRKGRP